MNERSLAVHAVQARRDNGGTFGDTLRQAMTSRGYSLASFSRATGIAISTVSYYLKSGRIPTMARADLFAEILDTPQIAIVAFRALQRRCKRCGRKFHAEAQNRHHTVYCGNTCRTAAHRARARKVEVTNRRVRTRKMERAIEAHCRWCEPSGICREPTCALRGVSPLPLIQLDRRKAA